LFTFTRNIIAGSLFLDHYQFGQLLEKIAKAYRKENPDIFSSAKYDIPSLIWPPPDSEESTYCLSFQVVHVSCRGFHG
tara:strand:- start:152 stop:385 length:234 start_codon:yes stop_codon:yes gene_type:complete